MKSLHKQDFLVSPLLRPHFLPRWRRGPDSAGRLAERNANEDYRGNTRARGQHYAQKRKRALLTVQRALAALAHLHSGRCWSAASLPLDCHHLRYLQHTACNTARNVTYSFAFYFINIIECKHPEMALDSLGIAPVWPQFPQGKYNKPEVHFIKRLTKLV